MFYLGSIRVLVGSYLGFMLVSMLGSMWDLCVFYFGSYLGFIRILFGFYLQFLFGFDLVSMLLLVGVQLGVIWVVFVFGLASIWARLGVLFWVCLGAFDMGFILCSALGSFLCSILGFYYGFGLVSLWVGFIWSLCGLDVFFGFFFILGVFLGFTMGFDLGFFLDSIWILLVF